MKVKATCIVTENERGIHQVTFDEYVSPYAWLGLPNASGQLIRKSVVKRKRKERGSLQYELLESHPACHIC